MIFHYSEKNKSYNSAISLVSASNSFEMNVMGLTRREFKNYLKISKTCKARLYSFFYKYSFQYYYNLPRA